MGVFVDGSTESRLRDGARDPFASVAGALKTRDLPSDLYDHFEGTANVADSPVMVDIETGAIGGPASEVSVQVSRDAGVKLNDPAAPEIPVTGATLPTDPAEIDGFEVRRLYLVIHEDDTQYRIFAAGRSQAS